MSAPARGTAVLVAYYAPPAAGIAAQRLAGFVRHLPDFGWDPVLVAPRSVHYHRDDATLESLGDARVVRTLNPEPSRWLRSLAGARPGVPPEAGTVELRSVAPGGWRARVRDLVRRWAYVPDAQVAWIPWARRAALEVLREPREGPALVYSTSVPFSAHFAARGAARRGAVPWVAEYRDPWSVSPPQFGVRPLLRQIVDGRMDRDLVRSADALILTSEDTARRYVTAFGDVMRGPVAVVRNGFDAVEEDRAPAPGEALRLAYSGTLLHPSYAVPLVGALRALHEEEPGAAALDVYGSAEGWRAAGAVEPWARLHGMVPPASMPARLAGASAVVLLQPDPAHAQHIAGKLYEYLGSRRPVLAALPAACEAEELIRAHGELWRLPSLDPGTVAAALRSLLAAHRAGRLQGPRVSEETVAPLTRRAQTERLAGVFDAVAGR